MELRFDLQIIANWIEDGARVLDLGCGNGELLAYLRDEKNCICTGIETSEEKVAHCIAKGLQVIHGDIYDEIEDYPDNTFDAIVLSRTLQQVLAPARLITSLLRIGRHTMVSFPNFSHWRSRLSLLFTGHAPKTRQLPYEWYDTPNLRVITIKDFRRFTQEMGVTIIHEVAIHSENGNKEGTTISLFPNLLATYGIFLISSAGPGCKAQSKQAKPLSP